MLGWASELRRSRIRTYERVMREHGDVERLVVGPPGVRFDLYCVFHPDGGQAVHAVTNGAWRTRTCRQPRGGSFAYRGCVRRARAPPPAA